MTDFSLTRRTVLTVLPATMILSQFPSIRWVLAQDDEVFRRQLQVSRDIAAGLANSVREVGGVLDPGRAMNWQQRDYQGRNALAIASLSLNQEQLHGYVRDEFRETADAMVQRGVRLVPAPRDVERLSTVRTTVGESCPSAGVVMWDILFDSLGLLEERHLFREAFNAINGASDRVERMNDSISRGRWERAVDAFFDLLEFLLKGGTIIQLSRVLDDRLARRFLWSVTIRLVPFVGTGYAITAFGLAVHRHWDRLFCPR